MPWNNSVVLLAAMAVAVSQGGMAQSVDSNARSASAAPAGVRFAGGDRDPSLPPDASPVAQDKVSYDEVGYASWYGPDRAGTTLASGEVFDAAAVSAAHAMLPVPSFVEVSDLRSGRTILVRINNNAPPPKGQIISLSLGAARQLGVETDGVFPVRVRRTNPPEFERVALRNGSTATERLATPPALLNALRKRLDPAPVAMVADKPRLAEKAAKPAIASVPPAKKPVVAAPAVAKPLPLPLPVPMPAPTPPKEPEPIPVVASPTSNAPATIGDGRTGEAKPHWDPALVKKAASEPATPSSPPASPAKPPATSGGDWFLQVAAFSSEARAKSAAARVGGTVMRAGSVFRVRTGPYASAAAARAAVGAMAAKGYPGALPTR